MIRYNYGIILIVTRLWPHAVLLTQIDNLFIVESPITYN